MTMPSALEISRQATLKPVTEIAADAGGRGAAELAEHMDIDADGRIVGLS